MGLGVDSLAQGYSDLYEFDPLNNQWIQKTSLPVTGRWASGVFVIGDKAYIACGALSGGSRTNRLWEYDQLAIPGHKNQILLEAFAKSPAAFSIGNKGYLGTGYIGSNSVENDFYEYDQLTDTWTQKVTFQALSETVALVSLLDQPDILEWVMEIIQRIITKTYMHMTQTVILGFKKQILLCLL